MPPRLQGEGPSALVDGAVVVTPKVGVTAFILATFISLAASHWQLSRHRAAREKASTGDETSSAPHAAADEETNASPHASSHANGASHGVTPLVFGEEYLWGGNAGGEAAEPAACALRSRRWAGFCGLRGAALPAGVQAAVPLCLCGCAALVAVGVCLTSFTISIQVRKGSRAAG